MFVTVNYYVKFGRGDASETLDWDFELTDEEAAAYNEALHGDVAFSDIPILEKALARAYEEISEEEADNLRDTYIECFEDELEEEYSDEENEDGERDYSSIVTKEMIFDRWLLYVCFADDENGSYC